MVDPHILPEPEHTDHVAPARVLSVENAGIHESGLCQLQSRLCQADQYEFRPLRVLDSHSPGMAIFNMIGALFCEAAISQTGLNYESIQGVQFANISRGLLLGLVFNMGDLVVKRPSDSDAILLISRQPCLGSKYVADKKGARGFQNALGALFTQAKHKIVNMQKNKHDLASSSLLPWLDTSFISSPTSNPKPTVSQE